MRKIMLKKIALGMAIIFMYSFVFGCAGIKDDSARTKAEGAGAGATIGAIGGALLGQLIGGDKGSTLAGAAIGAAIGGIGGYAYGNHVAAQKAKYANQEDWLNASIAEARKKNSALQTYNRKLRYRIAQVKKEIRKLKAKHSKQGSKNKALLAKKHKIDSLLKEAKRQLAAAREEISAQNTVKADVAKSKGSDFTKSLDSEIAALKAHVKELKKRTEELASMSASMAV